MQTMLNLKIDHRMKSALKRLADKQFSSVSSIVKQAIEKHLQENGIEWRKEEKEK